MPGGAGLWDECLSGGYIRVGWGDAGDLRDFPSKEAFRAKFAEVYGQRLYKGRDSKITEKSNEVWTLQELEPGDLVIANKGTDEVLGVGTVIEPGYEWTPHDGDDRNNIVHVMWDTSLKQSIPEQRNWAFKTVAPVSQVLAAQILGQQRRNNSAADAITKAVPVDPLFRELANALDYKGQAILYGPPGTGKTYHARRFAVWWLLRQAGTQSAPDLVLSDSRKFEETEQRLSTGQSGERVWWVVANPKEWSWDRLFKDKRVSYQYGRLQRNYPLVRKRDLVVGYQSTPDKRIVALARVAREMYENKDGESAIDLEPLATIHDGLTYDELQKDDVLAVSEPLRFRCQGTLFSLTTDEFDRLSALLTERNPDLRRHMESLISGIGPITRLTFHPSYSYEDFIEGFRPVEAGAGGLSLRLVDGVFKRVCREAQANPGKPYLVLIDEINRANVAKVFGELITLLERDKRGLTVSLPQSREPFMIPKNVTVLGTMNTADRSIKLLDAALRRRFAFVELMPDSSLLQGARVDTLALDEFLDKLNRRISEKEGREKKIGHSFLLNDGKPVADREEFARRFRQEILPLLQEYCYEDYRLLAGYIGEKLVNKDAQTLNEERLNDAAQLLEALEDEFGDSAGTE